MLFGISFCSLVFFTLLLRFNTKSKSYSNVLANRETVIVYSIMLHLKKNKLYDKMFKKKIALFYLNISTKSFSPCSVKVLHPTKLRLRISSI